MEWILLIVIVGWLWDALTKDGKKKDRPPEDVNKYDVYGDGPDSM